MQRTCPLIGLPILDERAKRRRGKVLDILFQDAYVSGFLMTEKGWYRKALMIHFSEISVIGEDALLAKSTFEAKEMDDLSVYQGLLLGQSPLMRKPIYTGEGSLLGEVADVYIDEKTGKMKGIEVSDGLLADLIHGRLFVPMEQIDLNGETIIKN